MKHIILLISIMMTLSICTFAYAKENIDSAIDQDLKKFVREYTYLASDDDSKNSSREKAIKQLKSILLEEVGVYIETSLTVSSTVKNNIKEEILKKDINTVSSGITKLSILEEKWDGKSYYVKAEVVVNSKETVNLLNNIISGKKNIQKLIDLNKQVTMKDIINSDVETSANGYLNLGYQINQKYGCVALGTFDKSKFESLDDKNSYSSVIRFYINEKDSLITQENDKYSNVAPEIYKNGETTYQLYAKQSNRYLLVSENNDNSILYKCAETDYWDVSGVEDNKGSEILSNRIIENTESDNLRMPEGQIILLEKGKLNFITDQKYVCIRFATKFDGQQMDETMDPLKTPMRFYIDKNMNMFNDAGLKFINYNEQDKTNHKDRLIFYNKQYNMLQLISILENSRVLVTHSSLETDGKEHSIEFYSQCLETDNWTISK